MLTWWGHTAHDRVDDAVVERVHAAVLGGVGLLALHSAHYSKIFQRLLGTSCSLRWRNDGERELVWTVDPAHPIAAGVPHPIVIDAHEMYGEHFDIPAARRARLRQLVRGRRGVPRRLLLSARGRRGSSTSAPATRTTRSTTTPTSSGSSPTPSSGPRRVPTSRAPFPAARWRRAAGSHDRASARRRRRPRLGRPAAPRRLPLAPGHAGRRARRPRGRSARQARQEVRDRARRRGLEGPAEGRGPRRGQRLRPDLPARPDRDRGAEARLPRALREADGARRARGRRGWSGPPARPTASSTSPSITASAATSRSSRR